MKVHIGIANGRVVASGVGSDAHYTVTGDSVNLASRLTDIAEQGETVISHGVQLAVYSDFEIEDQGEISIKGITDPIHTYLLQGNENVAGKIRQFIGRQSEL